MEREQVTIRLPAEMKKELQQEADKRGLGFNSLVLLIIRDYLKKRL